MSGPWGYHSANGPEKWHEQFPIAKDGCRQSPIDIETDTAEDSGDFPSLTYRYKPENTKAIQNTGASWMVSVDSEGSSLKGGPLEQEHALWQFHAHWGDDGTKGSEHTLDGRRFASELHLVHWNKEKYGTPEEAAAQPDGLAVLGIFLKETEDVNHPELDKICDLLPQIQYKGEKAKFPVPLNPAKLLPESKVFFTYEGSLTTPPLYESVTWIVFKEPIEVSKAQLNFMRELLIVPEVESNKLKAEDKMVNNFRPPVPKGNRKLRQK
ncbi:hypothetical protein TCAL_10905 [Tigriopus californicus]|uniref:Carbonic anhydrase n=1 Tax=Tigriopus californicus TaxID=6832 RepID=A0A553PJS9_TIGCA|nr:carbonic anhydrase-like isoform X1 [Tigriopus californicus]TRY77940.1 hypothetical protein TCAL_10905 [Tigriopus californicus]|eukprot:TCALIF_10905-PA protein Name:"Similar to ca2 Carbonic anhydrase 2 (Tribolodon hakonensis)" AED:0.05 eAED:0.05 QI:526/1/1/1/1/1/6/1743/266